MQLRNFQDPWQKSHFDTYLAIPSYNRLWFRKNSSVNPISGLSSNERKNDFVVIEREYRDEYKKENWLG